MPLSNFISWIYGLLGNTGVLELIKIPFSSSSLRNACRVSKNSQVLTQTPARAPAQGSCSAPFQAAVAPHRVCSHRWDSQRQQYQVALGTWQGLSCEGRAGVLGSWGSLRKWRIHISGTSRDVSWVHWLVISVLFALILQHFRPDLATLQHPELWRHQYSFWSLWLLVGCPLRDDSMVRKGIWKRVPVRMQSGVPRQTKPWHYEVSGDVRRCIGCPCRQQVGRSHALLTTAPFMFRQRLDKHRQ